MQANAGLFSHAKFASFTNLLPDAPTDASTLLDKGLLAN
jgi:hypothetical protein